MADTEKTCAAKIGKQGCEKPRHEGSLFCQRHRHASNRIDIRGVTSNAELSYMMRRDGYQQ